MHRGLMSQVCKEAEMMIEGTTDQEFDQNWILYRFLELNVTFTDT